MSTSGEPQRRWTAARAPGGWTPLDTVLAAGALLLLLEEVAFSPQAQPKPALSAAALVVALPICWRSSHPGPVAGAVAAGYLASSVVSQGDLAPQLTVLPLLVVLFHAATRLVGPAARVWGGTTLVLTVGGHIATGDGDAADFWPWLLWGGAWLTGALVRRRTELAAEHAARAARLEAQQRTAVREAASQERDRIARELHDVVAHAVSVMVVQAGAERLRLGGEAGETRAALSAIEGAGRQALGELRTMLGVLRDAGTDDGDLVPLPGLAQIPALVERLHGAGLDVDLVFDTDTATGVSADHGPTAAELAAYRIVQEALTNVVRHAGPVQTRVRVTRSAAAVEVDVVNARGHAEAGVAGAGRGIVGMAERAGAVGGSLDAGPEDGGFRVRAVLPLSVDARVHR